MPRAMPPACPLPSPLEDAHTSACKARDTYAETHAAFDAVFQPRLAKLAPSYSLTLTDPKLIGKIWTTLLRVPDDHTFGPDDPEVCVCCLRARQRASELAARQRASDARGTPAPPAPYRGGGRAPGNAWLLTAKRPLFLCASRWRDRHAAQREVAPPFSSRS